MITLYKDYQPTGYDSKANFMGDTSEIDDWIVAPVIKTRDADVLSLSNFKEVLNRLSGESDTVQVHRFGHWACGWYELILVHPERKQEIETIQDALDAYCVLNEDDYSTEQSNLACEIWEQSNISDRLHYIKTCGTGEPVSIFAARRNELPDLDMGALIT